MGVPMIIYKNGGGRTFKITDPAMCSRLQSMDATEQQRAIAALMEKDGRADAVLMATAIRKRLACLPARANSNGTNAARLDALIADMRRRRASW
jgi:hypothetical protein